MGERATIEEGPELVRKSISDFFQGAWYVTICICVMLGSALAAYKLKYDHEVSQNEKLLEESALLKADIKFYKEELLKTQTLKP